MAIPPCPWAACSNAWSPLQWRIFSLYLVLTSPGTTWGYFVSSCHLLHGRRDQPPPRYQLLQFFSCKFKTPALSCLTEKCTIYKSLIFMICTFCTEWNDQLNSYTPSPLHLWLDRHLRHQCDPGAHSSCLSDISCIGTDQRISDRLYILILFPSFIK